MPLAVPGDRQNPLIAVQRSEHRMIHHVAAKIMVGFQPIHGLLAAGQEMVQRSGGGQRPVGAMRRRLDFGGAIRHFRQNLASTCFTSRSAEEPELFPGGREILLESNPPHGDMFQHSATDHRSGAGLKLNCASESPFTASTTPARVSAR